MALHRDIFWVGRQWAVTGFGVQAVDQRLKGAFDIELARLWDDDLPQRMRELAWLKVDDFEKALEVARSRFPAPARKSLPLVESVLELIAPAASAPAKGEVKPRGAEIEANSPFHDPPKTAVESLETRLSSSEPSAGQVSVVEAADVARRPAANDLSPPEPKALAFRIEHASAKFLPRWRIRH